MVSELLTSTRSSMKQKVCRISFGVHAWLKVVEQIEGSFWDDGSTLYIGLLCYVHHRRLPDLGDVGMCGFFNKV
jgi:hypothetical protein